MNKNDLFKYLRKQYNFLKEQGYNVLFLAPVRPEPYKTFLFNKDKIDSIAVIVPTFKRVLSEAKPKKYIVYDKDKQEIIILAEIRDFIAVLIEQKFLNLEVLYKELIVNKQYRQYVDYLKQIREEIVNIEPMCLYRHIIQYAQKCVSQCSKELNIKDTDLHTFDKKSFQDNLYELIRLRNIYKNLANGLSFKDSLITFEQEDMDFITQHKDEGLSNKKLNDIVQMYYTKLANVTFDINVKEIEQIKNKDTIKKLKTVTKTFLLEQFCKEENIIQSKLDISKYKNIYFTSDLHFGHTNILEYEKRDVALGVVKVEDHDNKLIENWNKVVTDKDLVFILGDIGFYTPTKLNKIIKQLNGDKILITGNHDRDYVKSKTIDKTLFKNIQDYMEINYKGYNICLMHYPILSFNGMYNEKSLHFFRTYT